MTENEDQTLRTALDSEVSTVSRWRRTARIVAIGFVIAFALASVIPSRLKDVLQYSTAGKWTGCIIHDQGHGLLSVKCKEGEVVLDCKQ